MTVDLTEDELFLIHKAINSKHNDLITDMIDFDVDNEEEQKKYKALNEKLDKILKQSEE